MRIQSPRRLKRMLALPIGALAMSTVLAACGSSGSSASSTGGVASASAGGVINWAYISDFPSWDPVVVGATSATQILSTIYEPLFTLNAQNQLEPALATGYKYNSAGNAITITLRPGLTFQDGSPVNAAAVAYNVQRIKTQPNSALKALWQHVQSATVLSATQVRLNLKETDYQIPFILANRSSLLASEKAAKANAAALNTNDPVGAGPFKVVKLVPDSSVTLEKWNGYWDAADDPRAAAVGGLELSWFSSPGWTPPDGGEPVSLVAFSNPCALRSRALETLARYSIPVVIAAEAHQLAGVQAAVIAGLGVALMATLGQRPEGMVALENLPRPEPVPLAVWSRQGLNPTVSEYVSAALRRQLGVRELTEIAARDFTRASGA